ncbi:MAG TPA: LptF/LptG family permease [bacterium]|nr:LptF/LptG family permease [bacterium]
MSILARYIAKDFFRYWLACLGAVVVLIVIAALLGDIDRAFSSWAAFLDFWWQTAQSLPDLLEYMLPFTVLLAAVFTFSAFSRNSELVAMKAAGMGLLRLMRPLVWVLVPVAAFAYFNQNDLYRLLHRAEAVRAAQEQNQWRTLENSILYLNRVDAAHTRILNATLFDWHDLPFRFSQVTTLPRGERAATGSWKFQDTIVRARQNDAWTIQKVPQQEFPEQSFPDVLRPAELDLHHMAFFDLYQEILQRESQGSPANLLYLEWYRKLAGIAAPFVMVLIGTPLSQFHFRRGRVAGEVLLTLLVGLVFLISSETLFILAKGGFVQPVLGALAVHGLFALLGLGLLRWTR